MSASKSRRHFMAASFLAITFAGAAGIMASTGARADDTPPYHIKMAIGGINWVPYAPVVLAQQLGLFQKHGVDLDLIDNTSGGNTITAVVSGSVDIGCGYFDHTTQLAAKGKSVEAFVLMTSTPGIALFTLPGHDDIKDAAGLAGHKVSAELSGSTNFLLQYYLHKSGIDSSKVAVVSTGAANTTIVAAQQGAMDAVSSGEPAVTMIQSRLKGQMNMLFDTRSIAGADALFGSDYPSGTLYAQKTWIDAHPKEAQAVTDAILDSLNYIETHTPQQVVDQMPPEVQGTNKAFYLELFTNMRGIFTKGGRFDAAGAKTAVAVLGTGVPDVAKANVDPSKLYTNQFVDASTVKAD